MDLEVFDSNFCLFVLFPFILYYCHSLLESSRNVCGTYPNYIQYMSVVIFPTVRWPKLTGDHLLLYSAVVKMRGALSPIFSEFL